MKTVAIYCRVSTVNHGQDISMQTRELRAYCKRRGLRVVGEYNDTGQSGSKDSRPELNRLMNDAKQRKFDAICVWKLDRFGRSLRHLVNALADLESLGVTFISLRDNPDLDTPSGRLMFQIVGAMAEFEHGLVQERVRAGMEHARAKGKPIGRPKANVNEAQIIQLRESGASWRAVAKTTGFSVGTVYAACSKRPSRGAAVSG